MSQFLAKATKSREFDLDQAIKVVSLVAEGKTYAEIFVGGDPKLPTLSEFLAWSVTNPELARNLRLARELSAFILEDEALHQGRELAQAPGSTQRVSAMKACMEQLRWSAERRNSVEFGNKGVQGGVVVPIQIVTSLNLGQEGAESSRPATLDVYTAKVELTADGGVVGLEAQDVPDLEIAQPSKPLPLGLVSAADLVEGQKAPKEPDVQ